MMMLTTSFLALVLLLAHTVAAIPLTVKLGPSETQCVYTEVPTSGSKIGFYFAVQSGGSFDINVSIKGPDDIVEYKEAKEKQGEFSFAVSKPGEYEFCLSNDMSTFSEKVVEFEVMVDGPRAKGAASIDADGNLIQAALPNVQIKDADKIEAYITQIEARASNMLKGLKYYKMRNNRNQSTVKSTERRIFWFSLTDLVLMVGMAGFHVTVVHFFFNGCTYSAFLNAHFLLVLIYILSGLLETILTRFLFTWWYSSQNCSLIKQIRKQKINLDTPILVRLRQLHTDRLYIALAIGNGTAATISCSGIFLLHNGHGGRGS
jgi:hypothetical protein